MNFVNSFILRAVTSILIGLLLALNPEKMTNVIVVIIGILFVLTGCFSLVNYLAIRKNEEIQYKPVFPIVGIGSLLFGVFLATFPDLFIKYLMYVLGGILILAGINQLYSYFRFQKLMHQPWYMFLFPVVVSGIGIFIVFNPIETAAMPFIIVGYTSIFYGITELIHGVRIKKAQRALQK